MDFLWLLWQLLHVDEEGPSAGSRWGPHRAAPCDDYRFPGPLAMGLAVSLGWLLSSEAELCKQPGEVSQGPAVCHLAV